MLFTSEKQISPFVKVNTDESTFPAVITVLGQSQNTETNYF